MLSNLLVDAVYIGIPEALLYALIGFLVVFSGIATVIFVVWAVGFVLAKTDAAKTKKNARSRFFPLNFCGCKIILH